jgi:hypothetical protein
MKLSHAATLEVPRKWTEVWEYTFNTFISENITIKKPHALTRCKKKCKRKINQESCSDLTTRCIKAQSDSVLVESFISNNFLPKRSSTYRTPYELRSILYQSMFICFRVDLPVNCKKYFRQTFSIGEVFALTTPERLFQHKIRGALENCKRQMRFVT